MSVGSYRLDVEVKDLKKRLQKASREFKILDK